MNGMMVFHTLADDSYMNSVANFRGCNVTSNTEITCYFAPVNSNRGNDSVVLNITAGTEIAVIETIGAAMASPRRSGITVMADDINSKYVHDSITSCGAISVLGGTYEDVEVITASQTLYSYDSGKTFVVNPAALTTLTLPTAAAGTTTAAGGPGWNVKIVVSENDGGVVDQNCNISCAAGEFFQGVLFSDDSNGTNSIANGTSNDHINIKTGAAQSDIWFEIISDGTYMRVKTQSMVDASDILFADTALT
tara:strand:+ start:43 stop:795 length:753 start_codon:yes stop_codon:yes gene_type:complete